MKYFAGLASSLIVLLLTACGGGGSGEVPYLGILTEAAVGKLIFEDTRLSANRNQSCATCHSAAAGFADPVVTKASPVSEGSIAGEFGNRNAPTSAYSMFSPAFAPVHDSVRNKDIYTGGQFIDGRVDTLEAQAKAPFINPVEMAITPQAVVNRVRNGPYAAKFTEVYGSDVFDALDPTVAFDLIAKAIAAFERSAEMNPFTSKFDCYLQNPTLYPLSTREKAGLDLFDGTKAKCSSCHTLEPDPVSEKVLFTSFQYFNIGVPSNLDNPVKTIDLGLGGRLAIEGVPAAALEDGKFKTPTLRNIALTAPYMHNGVHATLKDVIQHYDLDAPNRFVEPEVIANIAPELDFDSGISMGLSTPPQVPNDYADLEAFMNTLTDGTGSCF